jgi:hypothetical protein
MNESEGKNIMELTYNRTVTGNCNTTQRGEEFNQRKINFVTHSHTNIRPSIFESLFVNYPVIYN